jgi:hypothetical protein
LGGIDQEAEPEKTSVESAHPAAGRTAGQPDAFACRGRRLAACGPFRPCSMTNSSAWPLLQGLQPAGLHRADVYEHILALLGSDEAVAPRLGSNT